MFRGVVPIVVSLTTRGNHNIPMKLIKWKNCEGGYDFQYPVQQNPLKIEL
jgi:hypothetical protein